VGSFKTQYLSVTVFSAVTNALMLAPSWYMLQVYDRVLTSHDDNTLLGLSLIVMFVYLIHALLERVRGRVLIEVAEDLDAQVAPRLHRRLLDPQLPAAQRDMQALSELQTVKQFLTGQPMLAFLDAPWAVIYLAVIFLLHPALGWLAVGSTLALVLLAVLNQRLTRAGLDRSREFATRELRLLLHQHWHWSQVCSQQLLQLSLRATQLALVIAGQAMLGARKWFVL